MPGILMEFSADPFIGVSEQCGSMTCSNNVITQFWDHVVHAAVGASFATLPHLFWRVHSDPLVDGTGWRPRAVAGGFRGSAYVSRTSSLFSTGADRWLKEVSRII